MATITLTQAVHLGRIAGVGQISKGAFGAMLRELEVFGARRTAAEAARVQSLAGSPARTETVDRTVSAILESNGIHPEVRCSDALDFHDLSVTSLRSMLAAAYRAGAASAKAEG